MHVLCSFPSPLSRLTRFLSPDWRLSEAKTDSAVAIETNVKTVPDIRHENFSETGWNARFWGFLTIRCNFELNLFYGRLLGRSVPLKIMFIFCQFVVSLLYIGTRLRMHLFYYSSLLLHYFIQAHDWVYIQFVSQLYSMHGSKIVCFCNDFIRK